jgi:peptide/nickel transport system permease protein
MTRSLWSDAWDRFVRNRLALGALGFLVVLTLACFVGPWFSPYRDNTTDVAFLNQGPSARNWLGTDLLGRDILTRLLLAGQISLTVGLLAMVLSLAIGFVLGALAGYYRGVVDAVVMRVADILMTIPSLPLLIILGAILSEWKVPSGARLYLVMVVLGLIGWPGLARMVRAQILSIRERDFMVAAEVLGLSVKRKVFHHLLPNTVPLLLVSATLNVAGAILNESVLSYLGLGVVPPTPSWGNMLDSANSLIDFQLRPWVWIPPGTAILLTVLAINLVGDGLRDALDPKLKT